jgi:predicted permease
MASAWFSDLRSACRTTRRSLGLTAFVALILALGLGAGGGLVALVENIQFRPVASPYADRLAVFSLVTPAGAHRLIPQMTLAELDRRQDVLDGVSGYTGVMVVAADLPSGPAGIGLEVVTNDFFGLLGVVPHLGRLLTSADNGRDSADATLAAVLSYPFWQREFGGDPGVIGRELRLNAVPMTIVGVTPERFTGVNAESQADLTISMNGWGRVTGVNDPRVGIRANFVIARLKEGVTLADAEARLRALWPAVRVQAAPALTPKELEEFTAQELEFGSFRSGFSALRMRYSESLGVLLWLMGALFVLVAANVAGLLAARRAARDGEIRTRVALGASRVDLVRLSSLEAIVYVGLGLLAAVPLSYWVCTAAAATLWAGSAPMDRAFSPGPVTWSVMALAVLLVLVAAGVLPAMLGARAASRPPGSASHLARAPSRWLGGLVVGQFAACMALVFASSLLAGNLAQWRDIDPGFDVDGITLVYASGQAGGYRDFDPAVYYPQVIDAIEAMPGVERAGLSHSFVRFNRDFSSEKDVFLADGEVAAAQALSERVAPGFFETLGIAVRRGRDFTWADDVSHPNVAIVTESLERAVGRGSLIGQRIRIDRDERLIEVVGVVNDVRPADVRVTEQTFVFRPTLQEPALARVPVIAVRATTPLAADDLRAVVAGFGREYVLAITTLAERVDRALTRERITSAAGLSLAVLALLVSATGLGSLSSLFVRRRRREIGIRLALGASRAGLVRQVMMRSLGLALIGAAVGVPAAMVTGRLLSAVLINISPTSTVPLALAAVVLLVAAAAAALTPAVRAARTDPITALKTD